MLRYPDPEFRLLPLKSDIVFKMVFGDVRYTDTIQDFLAAALGIPKEEYEEIQINDPHLERDSIDDKLGILDVRVQLRNGKLISIEIQIHGMPYMAERVAFSTGRNMSRQIVRGEDYAKIRQVVTIVIAGYRMIKDSDSYRHVFRFYDPERKVLFSDVMEIHTLELPKLPNVPAPDAKENKLMDWLKLIRSEDREEIEMLATRSPAMEKAVQRLKLISSDEATRLRYEARELYLFDEMSRRNAAREEGISEGRIEGKAEGRIEGKAEGRIEGIAEGEHKKAFENARNFLEMGLPVEQVARGTGLSVEEVQELRKGLDHDAQLK